MYVYLFRDLGEGYFRKFRRHVYLEGSQNLNVFEDEANENRYPTPWKLHSVPGKKLRIAWMFKLYCVSVTMKGYLTDHMFFI